MSISSSCGDQCPPTGRPVQTRSASKSCGGVLSGQGDDSSAEVSGLVVHDIQEVEGATQQEEQED